MRKSTKAPAHPALLQDLPQRLTELEAELRRHRDRKSDDRGLSSLTHVSDVTLGSHQLIQFNMGKKIYAAGHTDVTHAGSNHSRGVRHIRFYEAGTVVLDIEGDFEDQQLGSNFRFKNVDVYTVGPWEADLVKLTDGLRNHAEERKLRFSKLRAAENARLHR